jgi:hypothetical protein
MSGLRRARLRPRTCRHRHRASSSRGPRPVIGDASAHPSSRSKAAAFSSRRERTRANSVGVPPRGPVLGRQIPHNPQWEPAYISGQNEHCSQNIDIPEHQPGKSTERQEAVDAGFAELVGTDRKKVVKRVWDWIEHDWSVPNRKSPFGDGTAAEKTVEILQKDGYC